MKVTAYCGECIEMDDEPVKMELDGSLFFNRETKSQSQGYTCRLCGHKVTIVVTLQ